MMNSVPFVKGRGCPHAPEFAFQAAANGIARNSQPSSVEMYVMSPAQTLSGSVTVNSRLSRFGAMGR